MTPATSDAEMPLCARQRRYRTDILSRISVHGEGRREPMAAGDNVGLRGAPHRAKHRQRRMRPGRGSSTSVQSIDATTQRLDRHAEVVSDQRRGVTASTSSKNVVDVDVDRRPARRAERVDAGLEQPSRITAGEIRYSAASLRIDRVRS